MGISSALGSSALLPAGLGFRNVLINGDMGIAQRATSAGSITGAGYHTVDRWTFNVDSAGTWTMSQENDGPPGFRKSAKVTCTTANTLAAGDNLTFLQRIEGFNAQGFKKGTTSATPFALSFWVKSNVTGTYIVELYDIDNSRQVSASYTIASSGTWERKTIMLPADPSGQLDYDANNSLQCTFWLTAGSTFSSGTLNTTWGAVTAANRAVGQVHLAASTNNYWQITGVQLEANYQPTPFEQRPYQVELALCQRYYEKTYSLAVAPATNTGDGKRVNFGVSDGSGNVGVDYRFKQEKRSTGYSATFYTQAGTAGSWDYGRSGATGTVTMVASNYATSGFYFYSNTVGANWSACWISGHLVFNDEL